MKKIMQKFLLLMCSLAFLKANAHTGKTFLLPQPMVVAQQPDLLDTIFCTRCHGMHKSDSASITFFGREALNHQQLGGYFGVAEKNVMQINSVADASQTDLYYRQIVHDCDGNSSDQRITMNILPYHESIGCLLHQHVFLTKRWYCTYTLPFVQVDNHVRVSYENVFNRREVYLQNLKNFFVGNIINEVVADRNLQSPLQFAKIDNKRHTSSGLSDAAVAIGYQWQVKNDCMCAIQVSLLIPLSNKPTAEFLFEPMRGNGKHVGLGVVLQSFGRVIGDEHWQLHFLLQASGQYLVQNTQKRTLGLKDLNWAHYYLLGKESREVNQPLVPAANILTQDIISYPGWNYQGMGEIIFHAAPCFLGLGYQVYVQDHEYLKLKNTFSENHYAFAQADFETNEFFAGTDDQMLHSLGRCNWIMEKDIDKDGAQQQSVNTHTLFLHGGFAFKKIMSDIGIAYTYTRENSALESLSGWLRASYIF